MIMVLKMNSRTKPVKIRIKSGGEEHVSLSSLKGNFHVLDVCELLDTRLSRWLRQQGQQALAEELEVLFPVSFEKNDETITSLFRIFYRNDVDSSNFSLLDFAKYWYERNEMVNFMNLLRCNLTVAKYYFYNQKPMFSDNEWEVLFLPYGNKDNEVNDILEKIKCSRISVSQNNTRLFLEKAKLIIIQYKKFGRNYDIDYENEDEVNLVEFLNLCHNTKNFLTNWEIKGYYVQIESSKQFNSNKKEPRKYKNEWSFIRAITKNFMESGNIKAIHSYVSKFNLRLKSSPDKITNSWDLKMFIDSVVDQLFE